MCLYALDPVNSRKARLLKISLRYFSKMRAVELLTSKSFPRLESPRILEFDASISYTILVYKSDYTGAPIGLD